MYSYINSVRQSVKNQNWYSALSLAITLPDICGRLEAPKSYSFKRYKNWFNKYMSKKYTLTINSETHVFLSGNDCYALRCSFLHEGHDSITEQDKRQALDSFHFVAPPSDGSVIHCNQAYNVLQLQVDIFCDDICLAVEEWINEMSSTKPEVIENFSNLLTIHSEVSLPGIHLSNT
jgi:hypothetical protein